MSDEPLVSTPFDTLPLLHDRPLDAESESDHLGQRPARETLVRALRSLPTPACVALDGPWGAGKTTLARAAYRTLKDAETARVVWFDPWPYERADDVVTPLLLALRTQLDLKDTSDKLKRLAAGVAKTALSFGVRAAAGYLFGGLGGADSANRNLAAIKAEDFQAHWETLEAVHDGIRSARDLFRQVIDDALEGMPADSRLYVFLDDLDRCLPDNVVSLLEAVKLLLCGAAVPFEPDDQLPRVVFLFALDRAVVGEAIMTRYPKARRYTGETYLEKIFDLSLQVPPATDGDLHGFVHLVYDALDAGPADARQRLGRALAGQGAADADNGGLHVLASTLALPVFANPRVLKRTLNRLVLLLGQTRIEEQVRQMPLADVRRLITWVAGAERFRAFRRFFADARKVELMELDQQLKLSVRSSVEQNRDTRLQPSPFPPVAALSDLPGVVAYCDALGLAKHSNEPGQELAAQQERSAEDRPPTTLADFDHLMRSVGL